MVPVHNMHHHANADQVEIGRLLIEAGADVNVKDHTIQSAYLIPTADGSLEFLKLTLANGADVHSLDSYNGTGLIRAAAMEFAADAGFLEGRTCSRSRLHDRREALGVHVCVNARVR